MAILPIGQFPFPNLCNLCSISPQLGSYLSLSDAQEAAAPSLRWQEKLPRHLGDAQVASTPIHPPIPTCTLIHPPQPTYTPTTYSQSPPPSPHPPRHPHVPSDPATPSPLLRVAVAPGPAWTHLNCNAQYRQNWSLRGFLMFVFSKQTKMVQECSWTSWFSTCGCNEIWLVYYIVHFGRWILGIWWVNA